MITAFVFDFDGTLFDSSEANVAAYDQAFREAGVHFNETAYRQAFGLRFQEMIDKIAPKTNQAVRDKIKAAKTNYYQESLSLIKPNSGLIAFLESIAGTYKTALVTTASKTNVANVLAHFGLPESLFTVIVTAEDVTHSKPHPECYQRAMEALQVEPSACIVFEDSDIGVAAAKAASAQVIRIAL